MSCARVQQYTAKAIFSSERHNERKNDDYSNINVVPERIPYNVHFKDPEEKSYLQILKEKEDSGELSRRGLRENATIFDEVVFDINTMYFEENGGYEYAKSFYEEAYRYACSKFGEENIVSAVMHADELNKAATEQFGYPIYHYHLHVIAFPVVEKKILWTKKCKNPNLVGTIKEVIHQISHSKKWESKKIMIDDNGNPVLDKYGNQRYRKSYSVLQDEFFEHMITHGFEGFVRGNEGNTVEHLSSLDYQINQDKDRLREIEQKVIDAKVMCEVAGVVHITNEAIQNMGKKNPITRNITVSNEDYEKLISLAKEGITSRYEIQDLNRRLSNSYRRNSELYKQVDTLQERYETLLKKCETYLDAIRRFPDIVKEFIAKVQDCLLSEKSNSKSRSDIGRSRE